MKRLAFAVLCSLSLSACAQSADSQAGTATDKAATGKQAPALQEPVFAEGTPEARVRAALKALNPRIAIESINPAPMPGYMEVVATGQVVYVSEDGKYLMQGSLLDVANRRDLTEQAMAKVRTKVLATIPQADRIVFAPSGATTHTITVMTDIECGYCRKFHEEIAEHNKRGIRVEYIAYPRAGLASQDYRDMVSVWCAEDRKQALTDAKAGRRVPARTCARTPVDMQFHAGQRMGLEGTPMILTEDGQLLGGYLTPDQLLVRLEAAKLEAGSKGG